MRVEPNILIYKNVPSKTAAKLSLYKPNTITSGICSKSHKKSRSLVSFIIDALKTIFCCEPNPFLERLQKKRTFARYCDEVATDLHIAQRVFLKYPDYCSLESFPKSIQQKVQLVTAVQPQITESEAIAHVLKNERLISYKKLLRIADSIPEEDLVREFYLFSVKENGSFLNTKDQPEHLEFQALTILGKYIEQDNPREWFDKNEDVFLISENRYAEIAHAYLKSVMYVPKLRREATEIILLALNEIQAVTTPAVEFKPTAI